MANAITSVLRPLPYIPTELFALFLCTRTTLDYQLDLATIILTALIQLLYVRPSVLYEVLAVFIGLGDIQVHPELVDTVLTAMKAMVEVTGVKAILVDYIEDVCQQAGGNAGIEGEGEMAEPKRHSSQCLEKAIQAIATFDNGLLIMPSSTASTASTASSSTSRPQGGFRLISNDVEELRSQHARTLRQLLSANMWTLAAGLTVLSSDYLELLLHYQQCHAERCDYASMVSLLLITGIPNLLLD